MPVPVLFKPTGARVPMKNTIAVMNTKGGVGKSTIVLGLAETLSEHLGKTVLVIDSRRPGQYQFNDDEHHAALRTAIRQPDIGRLSHQYGPQRPGR